MKVGYKVRTLYYKVRGQEVGGCWRLKIACRGILGMIPMSNRGHLLSGDGDDDFVIAAASTVL